MLYARSSNANRDSKGEHKGTIAATSERFTDFVHLNAVKESTITIEKKNRAGSNLKKTGALDILDQK
jgi:hypothetical protein